MPDNTGVVVNWVEQGLVPDRVVRLGIRRLLKARLVELNDSDPAVTAELTQAFASSLRDAPLALLPEKANEQHYEVPAAFFAEVLGPHRKYSACWWPDSARTLAQAEAAALQATCERAGLVDGQDILELGCGWGSLTLWMAAHYPNSQITALSNSRSQGDCIREQAAQRGLPNVHVVTCDFNDFATSAHFDRIVSVEMFEHMRNYDTLMQNIAHWLTPGGTLFVHIFTHRCYAYPFEIRDESDWMAKYFFTGGIMPSDDIGKWTAATIKKLANTGCKIWIEIAPKSNP